MMYKPWVVALFLLDSLICEGCRVLPVTVLVCDVVSAYAGGSGTPDVTLLDGATLGGIGGSVV